MITITLNFKAKNHRSLAKLSTWVLIACSCLREADAWLTASVLPLTKIRLAGTYR
jgi:hypothetical protein